MVYRGKNEGITFRSTIKTTKGGSVGPQFGRVKAPFASAYEGPMVLKHQRSGGGSYIDPHVPEMKDRKYGGSSQRLD